MKIWIKYIIGIILGIIFTVIAGSTNQIFVGVVETITSIGIQFGRYSLYPVLFFGFALGIYNLYETKRLGKLLLFFLVFTIGTTLLLSIVGVISFWIGAPSRIPIFLEEAHILPDFSVKSYFLEIFSATPFGSLTDGVFILPLCIFGAFAGIGCASLDKEFSKPALNVFDSFARVAYSVMTIFVDFLAIFFIAISAFWLVKFKDMLGSNLFTNFIILLIVNMVIIVCGVYPLIIKLLCRESNPYKVLYASLAPIFVAFFTGDANATLPVTIKHLHESLGVRRRISNVLPPLFSIFSRAGTAMVLTISFMVIFKSYSSQKMEFSTIIWLVLSSSFFSLFLGRLSNGSIYIVLANICALYGSGYEAGYLILKPAVFFLGAIATVLDTCTVITGSYIVAYHADMATDHDLRFFI